MVNMQNIPPDMKELVDDENMLNMFLDWPMTMRASYIYTKVTHEGWPVEKSCILFAMSSTWYRNQVLRFSVLWDQEHQETLDEDIKYNVFFNRASDIMNIDFVDDNNKYRLEDIIASIPPFKNEQNEELFEYDHVEDNVLKAAVDIFDCDDIPEDFIQKATELVYEPIEQNAVSPPVAVAS